MLTPVTQLFLVSATTLALCHYLLLSFALYWRMPWTDLPMHIFGGIVVALGWFALGDLGIRPLERMRTLVHTLTAVLVVATLWEVYEYAIWHDLLASNYKVDTGVDMVLGVLGGILGYSIAMRLTRDFV